MSAFHSHECTGGCERETCACYSDPCPHRLARSNQFVCGFCRIGVQGPKPKQDALSTSEKDLSLAAIASGERA